MAKVDLNAITQHFRGRVGDLVFRRHLGKLITALRPKPTETPPSEAQNEQRKSFKRANQWAQKQLADPTAKTAYERAGERLQKTAFSAAMADFFSDPTIEEVDLKSYHGLAGDKIEISATDIVDVLGVHVLIRAADGSVIEEGEAVFGRPSWTYTATTPLPAGQPVTIEVVAADRAGNTATVSEPFPPAASVRATAKFP
jgi:hypothetical protein